MTMFYARIIDSVVIETVELPKNIALTAVFVPEIAAQFVEAGSNVVAGWTYSDGAFLPPDATVDLETLKAQLKRDIDHSAEIERLKYITPGTGQAMTYQQKVSEAQAFKAASNPNPSDYPILSSEVGITAGTLADVADIVLAAFAQWQLIGAMIESIRLGAKRDIDAAQDEAAARAIVDAIVWPSALVQA